MITKANQGNCFSKIFNYSKCSCCGKQFHKYTKDWLYKNDNKTFCSYSCYQKDKAKIIDYEATFHSLVAKDPVKILDLLGLEFGYYYNHVISRKRCKEYVIQLKEKGML